MYKSWWSSSAAFRNPKCHFLTTSYTSLFYMPSVKNIQWKNFENSLVDDDIIIFVYTVPYNFSINVTYTSTIYFYTCRNSFSIKPCQLSNQWLCQIHIDLQICSIFNLLDLFELNFRGREGQEARVPPGCQTAPLLPVIKFRQIQQII